MSPALGHVPGSPAPSRVPSIPVLVLLWTDSLLVGACDSVEVKIEKCQVRRRRKQEEEEEEKEEAIKKKQSADMRRGTFFDVVHASGVGVDPSGRYH